MTEKKQWESGEINPDPEYKCVEPYFYVIL